MGGNRLQILHFTDDWHLIVRIALFYLREHVILLSFVEIIAIEMSGLRSATKNLISNTTFVHKVPRVI
jgi:hypothetical protein